MVRYNMYFVTYYDEEAKKVLEELKNMEISVINMMRSSILKEFYYITVEGSENLEDKLEERVKKITGCWVKVERVR
ncbi:MAG: hypothetical protein DRO15_07400 [Thermoprotei archaeon]|nr:MAG: hypothetical protein DRO15_07400 [Thermoprotei archaeon]